jgi:hypothetical protein
MYCDFLWLLFLMYTNEKKNAPVIYFANYRFIICSLIISIYIFICVRPNE